MSDSNLLSGFAKLLRVVTVPPVMVCTMLLVLFFTDSGVFADGLQLLWAVLLLMLVPLLAYPLAAVIPSLRQQGRDGQRKLAFVTSTVGYAGAVIYGLTAQVSRGLMLIVLSYFLSVLTLILFNKGLGLRASGHACSITGPLLIMTYFLGWACVVPCMAVFAAIIWSSLRLKRHTPTELLCGTLCAVLAFAVSLTVTLI